MDRNQRETKHVGANSQCTRRERRGTEAGGTEDGSLNFLDCKGERWRAQEWGRLADKQTAAALTGERTRRARKRST